MEIPELPATDPMLIAALRDPDQQSEWNQFEKIYRPAVIASLQKFGLSYTDAEDCCQKAFIKIVRSLPKFIDDGKPASFRRWLYRLAKNETISHWRTLASQRTLFLGNAPFPQDDIGKDLDSLAETIELEYQRHVFRKVASKVQIQADPKHWQAFWKTAVEGIPTPLVAKELQMSVGAIYVAKGRILKQLQTEVKALEGLP